MSSMGSLSPYMQYSSGGLSPHHRSQSAATELEKFLSELLQEIMRLTSLIGTSSYTEQDPLEHGSPLSSMSSGRGVDLNGCKHFIRIDVPVDTYPNFNFVGRLLGPRGNSLKLVENSTGCRVFIRGRGSVRDGDKEKSLRDKPGYEHLNVPLHVLIEAEFPSNIIDIQLNQAREIIEDLLRPVEESQDYSPYRAFMLIMDKN
ncbi:hypothetical protein KP509_21G020200 [Ceratopteris richardii]|uniref:K Homology domain-containing protein n=1 Tax=Ceratopteris richardii TaxID=49495 RepID=A0A8T2S806_CERRI|nr:hypothetical protein KP509_21G020200 [Ceratopteris richardii]